MTLPSKTTYTPEPLLTEWLRRFAEKQFSVMHESKVVIDLFRSKPLFLKVLNHLEVVCAKKSIFAAVFFNVNQKVSDQIKVTFHGFLHKLFFRILPRFAEEAWREHQEKEGEGK